MYKDFKFTNVQEAANMVSPKNYTVSTRAPQEHFLTTSKKEHKPKVYTKPEIDSIPYP